MFLGRTKIRLATPSQLRSEAGRSYRAFIGGEIDLDTLKGTVWALKTLSEMMRGPEAEHLLKEVKVEFAAFQKAKANGADRPRAH